MISLFKKKKIEFYTLVPGLELLYPIKKASQYRPNWLRPAVLKYKQNLKEFPHQKNTTVTKCPGILSLFNTGYILYNYCDIAIKVDPISKKIAYNYAWDQKSVYGKDNNVKDYVSFHTSQFLTDFMEPPIGANKDLLKLSTPWRIKAPKDIVFLECPIFYSDDKRFCTAGGILDPSISRTVDPAFWWFVNDGSVQILKAGTPLLQYIPIKRNMIEQYDMVVREANEKEIKVDRMYDMLIHTSLNTNINTQNNLSIKIHETDL